MGSALRRWGCALTGGYKPLNCLPNPGPDGKELRCERCGQFHLRPGYCQALESDYTPIGNPCLRHVTDQRFLPVDRGGLWVPAANRAVPVASVSSSVSNEAANKAAVSTPVSSDEATARRREYMRDLMRKKREKGE